MPQKLSRSFLLILALALSACNLQVPSTPLVLPTSITSTPLIAAATSTLPGSTATPVTPATLPAPTTTTAPLPVPTVATPPVVVPASSDYIDDRSTPSQVIVSFYNAIDRREYSRAYGYYGDPAGTLGDFTAFSTGYADTASVDLVFGQITGDPGMSQVYYTVPVILKVTKTDSTRVNYAACYVVHETNPAVYGAPPISPMNINTGTAVASSLTASDASVLAAACAGLPTGGNPPFSAYANGLSIDKNNFVDNTSGAIETVSSLLNALNLKQYVRAYSYFQHPTTYPGPYDPWAAGFSNTDTINVTFGTVTSEGAAGSLYFKVPLAQIVQTTSSTTQTFVGCYTLRLGQPGAQITPPFQPMGIVSGKFNLVANGSNINSLLPTACN